jgi:hypothetical protein
MVAHSLINNYCVINRLKTRGFGWQSAIKSAEVKSMSLRNKVVFALSAVAALAGLGLAFTTLNHASIIVASAVWGS